MWPIYQTAAGICMLVLTLCVASTSLPSKLIRGDQRQLPMQLHGKHCQKINMIVEWCSSKPAGNVSQVEAEAQATCLLIEELGAGGTQVDSFLYTNPVNGTYAVTCEAKQYALHAQFVLPHSPIAEDLARTDFSILSRFNTSHIRAWAGQFYTEASDIDCDGGTPADVIVKQAACPADDVIVSTRTEK